MLETLWVIEAKEIGVSGPVGHGILYFYILGELKTVWNPTKNRFNQKSWGWVAI